MSRWNDWGEDPEVIRVLQLIEAGGYSVHVRRMPPLHDGAHAVAVEISAVRSSPQPVCQIVEVGDDPDKGEYLAAVQLAVSLGIPVLALEPSQ